MNFRYRLMQFMSGRYGMDELSFTLLITAMATSFANIIIRHFIPYIAVYFIQISVYILVFYVSFRVLSRNIEARRRENDFFLDKLHFFKRKRDLHNQRKNDKSHVYKKCPSCKAILRLPHRIGNHTTICPRCGKEFKVNVKK